MSQTEPLKLEITSTALLIVILVCCILLRAATLEVTDLIDPTESRYAVIAQEMFLSGDWLTPKLPSENSLIPYLGKPPLHFWLTALAYELFDVDEWTSRLPSFLAALTICSAAFVYGLRFFSLPVALLSVIITLSSGLFFFFAGASVTDMTLSACVATAVVSFALNRWDQNSRIKYWGGLLFFVALAAGFLTKGPVGIVLPGLPILALLLSTRSISPLRNLPWLLGIVIFLLITVPWFYLAEKENPGFLQYFFINENFLRYFVHDYGDRYGTGHVYPRGSVWIMYLLSLMPWTLIIPLSLMNSDWRLKIKRSWENEVFRFAIFWGLSPAIFFTLVKQLHAAYVLPGVAGLCIAAAYFVSSTVAKFHRSSTVICYVLLIMSGLIIGSTVIFGDILSAIISFVLLGGLYLIKRLFAKIPSSASVTNIGLTGLSSVIIFTIVILQASPQVASNKSSEILLQYLTKTVKEDRPIVGILSNNSYSLNWVSNAWEEELYKPVQVKLVSPETVKKSNLEHLLVKTDEVRRLPKKVLKRFKAEFADGKWIWLKAKKRALKL